MSILDRITFTSIMDIGQSIIFFQLIRRVIIPCESSRWLGILITYIIILVGPLRSKQEKTKGSDPEARQSPSILVVVVASSPLKEPSLLRVIKKGIHLQISII